MRMFKDVTGREWTVDLTTDAIKRIRSLGGVDLLKVVEDNCKLLGQLADDPVLLVDVLYVACKAEADSRQVTAEQFGRSMRGDAIWAAFNALVEDLVDFFPDPRKRTILAKLMAKMTAAAGILQDRAEQLIDQLNPSDVLKTLNG